MEPLAQKVIYTFKAIVREVRVTELWLDIFTITALAEDISHLVPGDFVTIKVEIPCPTSQNTNQTNIPNS